MYLIGLVFLFLFSLTIITSSQNDIHASYFQNTSQIFFYSNSSQSKQQDNAFTGNNISKPQVIKERFLEINFRPLESEGLSNIEIELLNNEVYKVTKTSLEKRAATNYTWRGKIYNANGDGFDVILTVIDDLMTGLIYTPKKSVYQIIPTNDGAHKIVLIDQSKFGECQGSVIPPESIDEANTTDNNAFTSTPTKIITEQPVISQDIKSLLEHPETKNIAQEDTTQEDGANKIDVLVLYTSEALQEAGGINKAKVHAQGAIDATNTAYANSKISTRLNLAQVDIFNIPESEQYSSILTTIRNNPSIATMRENAKADLVSLIVSSPSSSALCGIAFLTAPSSSAFSVVNFGCAIGNLTFAHELGHNMGCQHNPENGSSPSVGGFPFSFGHFEANSFRTVLATASPNDPCGNCPRVAFFSNPNVSIQGAPTGVANQRDNARTINGRASIIANFSQADSDKGVSLTVTPSFRTVMQGQSATFTLTLNRKDFADEISNSLLCRNSNDCPFSSNLIDLKTTSSLVNFTIGTQDSLAPGLYEFAVKATTSNLAIENSNSFLLIVKGTPSISAASFSKSTLKITGTNFESDDGILINNKELSSLKTSQSSTSVLLKGSKKKLNLLKGTNTISIVNIRGIASNTFTFSLLD